MDVKGAGLYVAVMAAVQRFVLFRK